MMNKNKIVNLKTLSLGIMSLALVAGFTSCKQDPNSPGYEFMPDMYRTRSMEYYGEYTIKHDGAVDTVQSARTPVAGTIARGYIPVIEPTMTYETSVSLKSPLKWSAETEAEGEVLYGKFCVHCHGATGAGDGKVAAKLPGPPPPYSGMKTLPEGKMFYSISKGKGLMGAHAPLLNVDERWKLVMYVKKLAGPAEPVVAVDSAAMTKPAVK